MIGALLVDRGRRHHLAIGAQGDANVAGGHMRGRVKELNRLITLTGGTVYAGEHHAAVL